MNEQNDNAIFSVDTAALLLTIQASSNGSAADPSAAYLLSRCGLLKNGDLTDAGRALFKLAWVLRSDEEAQRALGQALRQLTPLQVIEQELRGLGPIPEEGVLALLRQHRAIPAPHGVNELRPLLRWLNKVGVIAYSNKLKTVRSLLPAPDAALAGEVPAIASMISPKTPYLNVVRLRRILRTLRGVVCWADPHFGPRALEELAEEVDAQGVCGIRIISGNAPSVISERSGKDFKRFAAEMAMRGVSAEWRVDPSRDWHDRWLADDQSAWNVPPVNTLFKNDYSEIYPATERPPLETWWNRSSPRS